MIRERSRRFLAAGLTSSSIMATSISGTSVSATTYYSGSTPLNTILSSLGGGSTTYVQPGLNITTGGTANAPIVNLAGTITLTGATAGTVSATTLHSDITYSYTALYALGEEYLSTRTIASTDKLSDGDRIVISPAGTLCIYSEYSAAGIGRVITIVSLDDTSEVDFEPAASVNGIGGAFKVIGIRRVTFISIDGAGNWITLYE